MNKGQRSRYVAVITLYLDEGQRADCLAYANATFEMSPAMSPGQRITHLLEMRGRGALLEAWTWAEQQRSLEAMERSDSMLNQQGGGDDDK